MKPDRLKRSLSVWLLKKQTARQPYKHLQTYTLAAKCISLMKPTLDGILGVIVPCGETAGCNLSPSLKPFHVVPLLPSFSVGKLASVSFSIFFKPMPLCASPGISRYGARKHLMFWSKGICVVLELLVYHDKPSALCELHRTDAPALASRRYKLNELVGNTVVMFPADSCKMSQTCTWD